tara:strand:+ start:248 stop:457 length:210 start_codon:yes stop_codon:yes gene_type:complete
MSVKFKLYKVNAVMDTGNDKEPIVFSFDLPGIDEQSVGNQLNKMNSIRKIISIEETTPPKTGDIYKSEK